MQRFGEKQQLEGGNASRRWLDGRAEPDDGARRRALNTGDDESGVLEHGSSCITLACCLVVLVLLCPCAPRYSRGLASIGAATSTWSGDSEGGHRQRGPTRA